MTLVGERRVDIAIEEHDPARLQRRLEDLDRQLGAGGGVERRLGPRREPARLVQEKVTDALAGRRAARLAQHRAGRLLAAHGQPRAEQRVTQQQDLGGLAAAVDALEGDEQPAGAGGRARHARRVRRAQ